MTPATWVERYRSSGLTQRDFAQTHRLKLSRLRYWLYHRPGSGSPRVGEGGPRWQEVRLEGWPSSPGWGAEVSLPDGRTVRLHPQLARELIAPLLGRS
jgi:hypothetical protein